MAAKERRRETLAPGRVEHYYRGRTRTCLRLSLPHVEPSACAAAAAAVGGAAAAAAAGANAAAIAARHDGGRIFSTLANGELAKLLEAFALDTN